MRDTFHKRRGVMALGIEELGLTASHSSVFGGTSFWMQAPEGANTARLAADLRKDGVLIEPGGPFFADSNAPPNHYRIAYSSISADRIPEGLRRLRAHM